MEIGVILFISYLLILYILPLVYCLYLSEKEDDLLFKKFSFLPVANLLIVITYYTIDG